MGIEFDLSSIDPAPMRHHIRVGYKGNKPVQQTEGSAGADLVFNGEDGERMFFKPGERKLVPTGTYLEIPEGLEGQIRPRSGLALKKGLTVLNAPGTIDSDYRGEVGVILVNHSQKEQSILAGDRIAQLVLAPTIGSFASVNFREKRKLSKTSRGAGGFGSTGDQ